MIDVGPGVTAPARFFPLAVVARKFLLLPFFHLRYLIHTPAVLWPAAVVAGFVGMAWVYQLRPRTDAKSSRVVEILGAGLGIAAILWFFRFGQVDWNQNQDWQKELTYSSALKEAVLHHQMPYYLADPFQGTERYLANLETMVAPHAVLLNSMSIMTFFVLHVMLVFSLGYCGLVLLRRELELSPFSWAVFLTIFLCNGHITSHLGTGHTQWVGYFLLPWVLLCLVRAARGDCGIKNAAAMALSLSAMITIGGWHVFIWSFLFTLFFCLTSLTRLMFLARLSVMVACLSAFRLLPALVTFGGGSNVFLGSYRQLWILAAALVGEPRSIIDDLYWWEYDTYIGYVGFLILCLGAIPAREPARRFTNALLLPCAALLALSMYDVYADTFFHLPGFVSERVATRLLIMTVLGLSLVGCVRLDEWQIWRAHRPTVATVAALLAGWFLVVELVARAEGVRPVRSSVAEIPLVTNALKAFPVEAPYYWSVWVGVACSVVALVAVTMLFRPPRPSSLA
jgi:hypothetical protein